MSTFDYHDTNGALVLSVIIPAHAESLLERTIAELIQRAPALTQHEAADLIFVMGLATLGKLDDHAVTALIGNTPISSRHCTASGIPRQTQPEGQTSRQAAPPPHSPLNPQEKNHGSAIATLPV